MSRSPRPFVAHPRHPLTGRQFQVSARSRKQLDRILGLVELLREELRIGARSPVDVDRQLRRLTRGPVTLARATDLYVARADLSEHTRRRVRSWIARPARELRDRELDDLDAQTLAVWIGRLRGRGASSSVGLAWRTLRAVVRFAAERGLVSRVPWGPWRPLGRAVAEEPRQLREACRSAAELEQLVDAATAIDVALGAKVAAAGSFGLRSSELAALRWSDVDAERLMLCVPSAKGGARVTLEGPIWAFALLERHRKRLERARLYTPAGPVFPSAASSSPGKPRACTSSALESRDLRAAVERAGLPRPDRWSPHSLRDTFCTLEHVRQGGDLRATMARTRHATIASFLRYLRTLERPAAPRLSA